MLVKSKDNILHKDAKITILTLLKNFYDAETFNILIKEIYASDIDISLTAIKASSSIGNELAVSHLYKLIEKGNEQQKLASIQALSTIRAPSSINMLAKYYKIFKDETLRTEILKAINDILPSDKNAIDINRTVLLDPDSSDQMKIHAIRGMIEIDEFDFLKDIVEKSSETVKAETFKLILNSGKDANQFVTYFIDKSTEFGPTAIGTFIAAYLIKASRPQLSIIKERLQNSKNSVFTTFIQTISQYEKDFAQPIRVFRLLIVSPFVDFKNEAMIGDQIQRIIEQVKQKTPHLLNELTVITQAHLETVFLKTKTNYISLKGITERETLLSVVFANILERYANRELLQNVQDFFKSQGKGDPEEIIFAIRKSIRDASLEDKNRFEACIPLFNLQNTPDLLNLVKILSNINLERPNLLRRLNRLIRVAGHLKIRNGIKSLNTILQFARQERISFLVETLYVTLLELLSKAAIDQARTILSSEHKNLYELRGVLRGCQFLPAKLIVFSLIHFLMLPNIDSNLKSMALDSMKNMNLNEVRGAIHSLLKILESKAVNNNHKKIIGEIVSKQGDPSHIQLLIDLTSSNDKTTKIIAISTIREISQRFNDIPKDIIINKLYLILEDEDKETRIEALLGLISLHDDYALQVLKDYFKDQDSSVAAILIRKIEPFINHEILSLLLEQITTNDRNIQEALINVLDSLSKGEMAEEIRKNLIHTLKMIPEGKTLLKPPSGPNETKKEKYSIIEQAKLEFKFKRENSQILTVMFIDIVGYTEKSSSTSMTEIINLIQNFEKITLPLIKNYKGKLIKKMGDGLLAVFKHPLNAVLSSLAIQKKISEYNELKVESEKFQARIGLNTGLVIRKDDDIYGDVVNIASRMETSANPGDILLTQATYEHIKDYIKCTKLGNIQVKGKEEAIPAYMAEGVAMDISGLLKKSAQPSKEKVTTNGIIHFKESLFNPKYEIPNFLAPQNEILEKMSNVFKELTSAIEEISQNYHEEYIFKRYLQDKWNELLKSMKNTTQLQK